jgi:hypothetical protein
MQVKLPKEYSQAEVEKIINRVIKSLEKQSEDANFYDEITSEKLATEEKRPYFRRDGDTREILLRDQGDTFKLTFTKVT